MLTALAQTQKFCISKDGKTAKIVVADNDWKGVIRAANDLAQDIGRVSGTPSEVVKSAQKTPVIIAGTIGKSAEIDRLVKQKKIKTRHYLRHLRNQSENRRFAVVLDG